MRDLDDRMGSIAARAIVRGLVKYAATKAVVSGEFPCMGALAAFHEGTYRLGVYDELVGKRLSRLSPQTNQVLSIAAVIGRELGLLERFQDARCGARQDKRSRPAPAVTS